MKLSQLLHLIKDSIKQRDTGSSSPGGHTEPLGARVQGLPKGHCVSQQSVPDDLLPFNHSEISFYGY